MTERTPPRREDPATEAQIKRMQERLQKKCDEMPVQEQLTLCAAPVVWAPQEDTSIPSRCGRYRIAIAFVHARPHYIAYAKNDSGAFRVIDDTHLLDLEKNKATCQEHADRQVQVEEARNARR